MFITASVIGVVVLVACFLLTLMRPVYGIYGGFLRRILACLHDSENGSDLAANKVSDRRLRRRQAEGQTEIGY
jgi:hypothetical protein